MNNKYEMSLHEMHQICLQLVEKLQVELNMVEIWCTEAIELLNLAENEIGAERDYQGEQLRERIIKFLEDTPYVRT